MDLEEIAQWIEPGICRDAVRDVLGRHRPYVLPLLDMTLADSPEFRQTLSELDRSRPPSWQLDHYSAAISMGLTICRKRLQEIIGDELDPSLDRSLDHVSPTLQPNFRERVRSDPQALSILSEAHERAQSWEEFGPQLVARVDALLTADEVEAYLLSAKAQPHLESPQSESESPGETDTPPDDEQLDLALREMRTALDAQWDQWKHLETRLQFFLGWIATGASVSVALGVGKSVPNEATRVFLVGAGLFAIFTLGVLVLAYVPLAFERPPEPAGFAERYVLTPTVDTKLMLIDTIAEAYTSNQAALDRRTTLLRYAIEGAAGAGLLALLGLAATSLPPGWGG